MAASMTGYGRGEVEGSLYRFTVELRSVNHRFTDIHVRLPREFSPWEDPIRRAVLGRVRRGRVDAFITADALAGAYRLHVDKALALAYHKSLKEIQDDFGLEGPITTELLVQCPDLFRLERVTAQDDVLWAEFEPALNQALDGLAAMRRQEGQALAADFSTRLDTIAALVDRVEEAAPRVVDDYRRRLHERLQEWLPAATIDPDRVAAEVVLFTDRATITEELVRLRSHVRQLADTLESGGTIGRKLEFLLQEANREVNTIGSKSQDAAISSAVVDMKAELENLREQAQNIE